MLPPVCAVFLVVAIGTLLLEWTVVAIIAGVLFVLVSALVGFIVTRQMLICENAVLTTSIVISESPVEILALVNMDTGFSEEPVLALKTIRYAKKIPCYVCRVGQVIPCVSSFQGEELETWDGFHPWPLSFATGDTNALQKNLDLLDADDIALLRDCIAREFLPEKPNQIRWLDEDKTEKTKTPPPLPPQ
jgi:hypothetical protein